MAAFYQMVFLALAAIIQVESLTEQQFILKEDLATYFDNDYSVQSEKKVVANDFQYRVHRVKRATGPVLRVMTFNIKTYAPPTNVNNPRQKDLIIPRVRYYIIKIIIVLLVIVLSIY